ncbi:hypothetical protein Ciccas_003734 [Cichlidogyrus casuarinus]|uniref:Uncharacterized protein n=1 Tax=Cichlidogyrus casuarinus TaxID=1844966 RepID=A0ABD2QDJ4_9PLAT
MEEVGTDSDTSTAALGSAETTSGHGRRGQSYTPEKQNEGCARFGEAHSTEAIDSSCTKDGFLEVGKVVRSPSRKSPTRRDRRSQKPNKVAGPYNNPRKSSSVSSEDSRAD